MSAPRHDDRFANRPAEFEGQAQAAPAQASTGHVWDGIRELDTPLPRWWLILFWATIVFSIVYWVLMPAWPGLTGYTRGVLGQSSRANVERQVAALEAARAPQFAALLATPADKVAADPALHQFALAAGEAVFGDNCATCHGYGGAGAPGYPNLADDVWIWGGTLADIEHTLRVGARSTHPDTHLSAMPAFGRDGMLSWAQMRDLTEYVVALGRGPAERSAAQRGAPLYAQQCASCHGASGEGSRDLGAPRLSDAEWLKAGPRASASGDWAAIRASIMTQLNVGGGGVMPSWEARLDPGQIRALAIYVHGLGGGEAASTAAAPAKTAVLTPEEQAVLAQGQKAAPNAAR
jgi:cytochrome c oxidase cbb3-type subunit III